MAEDDFESSDAGVRIWDLTTKQCMHSHFHQESSPRCYTKRILFFGDVIVVCSQNAIRVYTQTLELVRDLRLRTGYHEGSYLKHGERLLSIFQGRIMSFDIHVDDGDPQELARIPNDGREDSYIDSEKLVVVCDNRWLLVSIMRNYQDPSDDEGESVLTDEDSGVYVINISTGSVKQFLREWYSDVMQSSDPKSFYAVDMHSLVVDVLELNEEGILTRKGNLPYLSSRSCWVHAGPHDLVVTQNADERDDRLQICNPIDGKIEKLLQFPLYHGSAIGYGSDIATNGTEVFVELRQKPADIRRPGFATVNGRGPAVIAVYLAKA